MVSLWYWHSHNIKALQQLGWTFTNILGSLQGHCSCHVTPSFNFSPGPLSTQCPTTTKVWPSLKASPDLTKYQASAALHDPQSVITRDTLTHFQVRLPRRRYNLGCLCSTASLCWPWRNTTQKISPQQWWSLLNLHEHLRPRDQNQWPQKQRFHFSPLFITTNSSAPAG